ncbi:MAG: response regulator [Anaerolineales bacterium]|nr:MAG: response regulator [Anaerolineales bacterium]
MIGPTRILIVDDEPDTVGLIEITLKPAGYLLDRAFSGSEALRKLKDQAYDLILMDVMMPEITGFDVVRLLHEQAKTIPPIIFLTAKSTSEDLEMGKTLGAAAYIVKPATRGQLLDAIKATLNKASDA